MSAKLRSRIAALPVMTLLVLGVLGSGVLSDATLAQSSPAPAKQPSADESACRKAALKFLEDAINGDMNDDLVFPPNDPGHRKEFDAVRAYGAARKRLAAALDGSKNATESKAWRERVTREKAQVANGVRSARVTVTGDDARVELKGVPASASPALQSLSNAPSNLVLVMVKKSDRWLIDIDRSAKYTGDDYVIAKAGDFTVAADAVAEDFRKERAKSPFIVADLFDKQLYRLGFRRGLKESMEEGTKKNAPPPTTPSKPATPAKPGAANPDAAPLRGPSATPGATPPGAAPAAANRDEAACRAVVVRVMGTFMSGGLDEKDIVPITDPAHRAMFDAMLKLGAGNKRMLQALRDAGFAGKADALQAEFDQLLSETESDIRGSTVNITGDVAKVSMTVQRPDSAAGKGARTYTLRRIDGRWAIDTAESKLTDGNPKTIEYLSSVADATEEVIADLKAGRVAEPFHAESLVEKKMMERVMRKAFEDAAAGRKKDAPKPAEPDEDENPAQPAGPPPGEIKRWQLDGTGRSMYLIPDTSLVLTGATRTPDSVHLWNLKLGSKLRSFKQDGVEFHAIAVGAARGGAIIVAGGEAFDPEEIAAARKDPASKNPYEEAGASDYDIRVWDGRSGKLLRTLEGHTGAVVTIDVSPDGKLVASGSHDATARVWNLDTGELVKTINAPHTYTPVLGVRFSRDGGELAVGTNEDKGSVTLYDTKSWDKVAQHDQERNTGTVEFSPDDQWTACVRLGVVVIYSRENDSKRVLACLSRATQATRVNSVAFSEDGKFAVTSEGIEKAKGGLVGMVFDLTPRIRVFDVARSEQVAMFTGIEDAVWSAAFTQDGKAIVSCSADGTLRLWALPEVMGK